MLDRVAEFAGIADVPFLGRTIEAAQHRSVDGPLPANAPAGAGSPR